jgi:hypothetical protein
MENLPMRIDVEAGGLFFVEGAESDEIGAGALERQAGADHIHDIAGCPNLFERAGREKPRHGIVVERRPAALCDN